MAAAVVSAEASRLFWVGPGEGSLIWLPAGIAVGLALVFGLRILPWIGIALFCWAGVIDGMPWAHALFLAVGEMLGPGVSVYLLRLGERSGRLAGPIPELWGFWACGLGVSVVIAATVAATSGTMEVVLGSQEVGRYAVGEIWGGYWAAEAFGLLAAGPITVRAARRFIRAEGSSWWRPRAWQLGWLLAVGVVALAQLALDRMGSSAFAAALVYFYFPLLALAAGFGTPLFQDLAIVLVGLGLVSSALTGVGGFEVANEPFDLIDVILLVIAFTIMTQLVGALASTLRLQLQRAREDARRDFLTGLYNDRELSRWINADADAPSRALALVDVPQVRRALDLMGLEQADEVERRVAGVVASVTPEQGVLARVGRGLYGTLYSGADEAVIQTALDDVYQRLDGIRHTDGGVPLTLAPVCGAVTGVPNSMGAHDVLPMASQILASAREDPGHRVQARTADSDQLADERARQSLVETIRVALTSPHGFALMRQPIVPLQAPEAVSRYELLVRLVGEDGSLISPGQFLGVAARFDLMPEIDRWVSERAIVIAARTPHTEFAVNLSGATLRDASLADWIVGMAKDYGAPPERLSFEITETETIADEPEAIELVRRLRAAGFRVALDDFGTGLASFEYLRRFPVDAVKIDGSFVIGARESRYEAAVVRAIQAVAATRGLATIAEFVEDESVRKWLTSEGVDWAQGSGLGRPEPFDGTS